MTLHFDPSKLSKSKRERIPAEVKAHILELRKEGNTVASIAEAYNLAESSIYRIAKEAK